jgi:hypothetical protein
MQMRDELAERTDCRIEHANYGDNYYAMTMLESYIALAPRGQGAASFRFFEAMALSVVPLYISDLDCRPFSKWLGWDFCSLWTKDASSLNAMLDSYDKRALLKMGEIAKRTYDDHLAYGKFGRYVIKELELL